MEKTCPNCGFKAHETTPICPNCGFKWAEVDDKTIGTPIDAHRNTMNDDIRWSDYKDVSIGEIEEQFGESHREQEKKETTTGITGFQPKDETMKDGEDTPVFTHKEAEDSETNTTNENESEVPLSAHDAEILSAYIRRHRGEDEHVISDEEIMAAEPSSSVAEGTKVSDTKTSQEASSPSPISAEAATAALAKDTAPIQQPTSADDKSSGSISAESAAPSKKKTKKIAYIAAAICLVAVAGGGWLYNQQQQAAAQEAQVKKETTELDQIQATLNEMFTDQDHVYLKSSVTSSSVKEIQQQLADFKENDRYQDLSAQADMIADKLAALDEINAYFAAPAVVENQLNEVSLKDATAISMNKRDEKDGFDTLINQAITMGQNEYQAIQDVQNAVKSMTALVKDGEAPDSVTRSNYNELMKKVQALPIESEVKTLSDALKTVDTSLTKRETAEKAAAEQAAAEKAAAEEAAAEEAAQAANDTTQSVTQNSSEEDYILSPDTPTNTNNQPIIPARQSDLADTTNSAWNWADGVKEKIIATAIARGYVVEGGYTLERVRIVNGEGYYNFYATNAEGSLLKGTGESALPMYLFTVNAKTGYFRGNGNDHTVR